MRVPIIACLLAALILPASAQQPKPEAKPDAKPAQKPAAKPAAAAPKQAPTNGEATSKASAAIRDAYAAMPIAERTKRCWPGSMSLMPMPTLLIQGMSDTIVRPINQSQLAQQTFLLNRLTVVWRIQHLPQLIWRVIQTPILHGKMSVKLMIRV